MLMTVCGKWLIFALKINQLKHTKLKTTPAALSCCWSLQIGSELHNLDEQKKWKQISFFRPPKAAEKILRFWGQFAIENDSFLHHKSIKHNGRRRVVVHIALSFSVGAHKGRDLRELKKGRRSLQICGNQSKSEIKSGRGVGVLFGRLRRPRNFWGFDVRLR